MNAANAPLQSTSLGSSSLENERRAHEPSMEEILASIRRIIADDDALPLSRPTSEQRSPPRLFETNVTPLVAPAAAAPASDNAASASLSQPSTSEAMGSPAVFETPAALEAPAAPVAIEPSHAVAEHVDPPELDDSERASFDEVGRELSQIEAAQQEVEATDHEEVADIAEPDVDAEPEAYGRRSALGAADLAAHEPEDHFAHASQEQAAHAPQEQAAPGMIMSPEANASVASAFQALSTSVQLASSEAIERQVRDMLRPMLKQWLDDNLPVMVERMVRAEIERVARGGR